MDNNPGHPTAIAYDAEPELPAQCLECGVRVKDARAHANSHWDSTEEIPKTHTLARYRAMVMRGEDVSEDLLRAAKAAHAYASAGDIHAQRGY